MENLDELLAICQDFPLSNFCVIFNGNCKHSLIKQSPKTHVIALLECI